MKIVVVGGTSGIGEATVSRLIENGHEVTSISRTAAARPVEGVNYLFGNVVEEEVPDLWDEIDGLVYAPGSINLKPFGRLKDQDFLHDFQVNVLGAARMLRQLHPALKKGNQGSVVLYSTVAVGQGMPYHASTAAAKGAVEGLALSLAAEWAPSIRVNVIAPSVTHTPMAERLVGTAEKKEASGLRHPLQRVGEPEDIAALTTFLLDSKVSSWITGQVIGADGGMSRLRR